MESKLIDFLGSWLGLVVTILAIAGSAVTAFQGGRRYERRSEKRELLTKRLEKLYVPLRRLLLDCHITTSVSYRFPTFGTRFRHFLRTRRLADLWYKGERRSAEIEFGRQLPLSEIDSKVQTYMRYADPKLVELVQAADRAWYEEREGTRSFDLVDIELDLIRHINGQYHAISEKLGRKS